MRHWLAKLQAGVGRGSTGRPPPALSHVIVTSVAVSTRRDRYPRRVAKLCLVKLTCTVLLPAPVLQLPLPSLHPAGGSRRGSKSPEFNPPRCATTFSKRDELYMSEVARKKAFRDAGIELWKLQVDAEKVMLLFTLLTVVAVCTKTARMLPWHSRLTSARHVRGIAAIR